MGDEHCNIFPRHLYITVPLRATMTGTAQFNIGTSPLAIYTLPFRSAPCDNDGTLAHLS
jgi:hypothetical protein